MSTEECAVSAEECAVSAEECAVSTEECARFLVNNLVASCFVGGGAKHITLDPATHSHTKKEI